VGHWPRQEVNWKLLVDKQTKTSGWGTTLSKTRDMPKESKDLFISFLFCSASIPSLEAARQQT